MDKIRIPAVRESPYMVSYETSMRDYTIINYTKIPEDLKFEVLKAQISRMEPCSPRRARIFSQGKGRRVLLQKILSRFSMGNNSSARPLNFEVIDVRNSIVSYLTAFDVPTGLSLAGAANFKAQEIRLRLADEYKRNSAICQDPKIWNQANAFLSRIIELNFLKPESDPEFLGSDEYLAEVEENLEFGKNLLNQLKSMNVRRAEENRALKNALDSSPNFAKTNELTDSFSEPTNVELDYAPVGYSPYETLQGK